ncbi:hypothetical protein TrLO_g9746 [Triparma laevis f. longispina]|uniref:Uncharacterized protein n=1 Tax=Triparma laevis f. longispina TaxID=1714387 RepID=A0A9W7AQ88_9STRA|nr:hypothetical protein TrLO_g9746 [Triparma laevis f. longispina]
MAPAIVPSLTSLCVAALAKNCVSERATVEPPHLPPNDDPGDPYTGLNETEYEQQERNEEEIKVSCELVAEFNENARIKDRETFAALLACDESGVLARCFNAVLTVSRLLPDADALLFGHGRDTLGGNKEINYAAVLDKAMKTSDFEAFSKHPKASSIVARWLANPSLIEYPQSSIRASCGWTPNSRRCFPNLNLCLKNLRGPGQEVC